MKKFISLFLILSLIFCFAACAGNKNPEDFDDSSIMDDAKLDKSSGFLYSKTDDAITIEGYAGDEEIVVIPDEIANKPVKCISTIESEAPIKEITLSKNVEELSGTSFTRLESLEKINVDENNPNYSSIDGVLFSKNYADLLVFPSAKNVKSYTTPDGTSIINFNSFYKVKYLETLIIGDGVTLIAENSICQCENLKEIQLSKTVNIEYTSAVYDSFNTNPNLKLFTLDENNPYLSVVDGVLLDKEQKFLISCPPMNEIKDGKLILPDAVETIGPSAFYDCDSVKEVVLSANLKKIASQGFSFSGIEKITIPTSVEFIDVSAFSSAENLKEVNFEGTVEQWSNIQVSDYNEPLLQNGVNCTDGKVTQ